jgi:hypothetical protein
VELAIDHRDLVQEQAQIDAGVMFQLKVTYLAVNSSKLSSWWPAPDDSSASLSESFQAEVLKLLADPAVAIKAGIA